LIAVVNSIEVGYDDIGAGTPVLFAHAFPLNRTMWAPNSSALVERCRCVAADFRGCGDSSIAPPYTVDQYADDLAGFAFWRRHRDRVRALVLANTRAGADNDEGRDRRRQLIATARAEGSTAVANAQIPSLVGKTTRAKQPDIYDSVHRMMAQAPAEGIIGALEAMMERPDSTETLGTIDVPTLIIVGEEDVPTPVKESRAMHERIQGSVLEVIQSAGHLSNIERPAAFNHILSEFLFSLTAS